MPGLLQELVLKRLMLKSVVLSSLLFSCVATADPESYRLPVHYSGRVLVEKSDTATSYTYSWPGIYFEAEFIGPELDVKLNDTVNILNLIIDDREPIVLNMPGKITHSLKNLGAGKHKVRLEKRTETQIGTGTFEGFYVPAEESRLKVMARKRKMEFIGDSFTVGYGNLSPGRACSNEEIIRFTNTHVAFGALTAKYFNADYQINAISGSGIVRNYNGAFPDKNFVNSYPYTFLNNNTITYKEHWSPQIIVMELGGNDFSTPLNPGEKWKSREALRENYVEKYAMFITEIRKQNPDATLILLAPEDPSQELNQQVNKVISRLKAEGESRIYFVGTKPMELSACQWHPSLKDHQAMSALLVDLIEHNSQFWKNK